MLENWKEFPAEQLWDQQMRRNRAAEMSDDELRDAIAEARHSAATEPAGLARLGEYSAEAGRRLVQRGQDGREAWVPYAKAVGARAFAVFWWLHLGVVLWLCFASVDEAGGQYGRPALPLVLAALLAGGLVVLRWVLIGRWRFGPHP